MISAKVNYQGIEKEEVDFPFLARFVYENQKEHAVILFYKTREDEPGFLKSDYYGIVLSCTDGSYKVGDYKFYDTKTNIIDKKRDQSSGLAYYELLNGSITLKNT